MNFGEFDFIIVGAGSAGCVWANRLSADPRPRVALLEAGPHDRRFWIALPIGYGRTMWDPLVNWQFRARPQHGRTPDLLAARSRARRIELDQWADCDPRPARGLRPLGRAWKHRLVVERRAAVFRQVGEQSRSCRKPVARQRRTDGGQQPQTAARADRSLHIVRAGAP